MMKTQIEIKENNIACTITSLEYDDINCNGRVYMTTKRVRKLLIENGHNPGNVIIESRVDNCGNKLQGTWVFEDMNHAPPVIKEDLQIEEEVETKKPAPKQTKTNRRKNSRKSKKSLDNSQKDVIIEE